MISILRLCLILESCLLLRVESLTPTRVTTGSDVTLSFADVTMEILENITSQIMFRSDSRNVQVATSDVGLSAFLVSDVYRARASVQTQPPPLSLTLYNVSLPDAGEYYVQFADDAETSMIYAIYVYDKPSKPVISSDRNEATAGEQFTLTCTSTLTSRPAQYRSHVEVTWYDSANEISANETNVQFSETHISILEVQNEDTSRVFTCTVKEVGSALKSDSSDPYLIKLKSQPGWGIVFAIIFGTVVLLVVGLGVGFFLYRRKACDRCRRKSIIRAKVSLRQVEPPRVSKLYSVADIGGFESDLEQSGESGGRHSSKVRDSVWWRGSATLPSFKTFMLGKRAAPGPERSATLRPATPARSAFARRHRRAIKTMDCTEIQE